MLGRLTEAMPGAFLFLYFIRVFALGAYGMDAIVLAVLVAHAYYSRKAIDKKELEEVIKKQKELEEKLTETIKSLEKTKVQVAGTKLGQSFKG